MSNPLRITQVSARKCRCASAHRGAYSTGDLDPEFNYWLLVAISAAAETGYGECVPTSLYFEPGHIGRSSLDEWSVLLELCQTLPGRDARELGRLIPAELQDNYDANSLVDAVDFALHDLVGRCLGVPLATLLGGIGRPFVYGMPVIHTDTPDAMAALAAEWHRVWGFRYFKLKPIATREGDVETLTKMRERMGPEVRYYMDANYALDLDPDALVEYLNTVHALGVEVYEDPVDADLEIYRDIRARVAVQIMLDDKARTPAAVGRIVQAHGADRINIHANWAGGFRSALRKAAIAQLGGISLIVGSTHYLGPGAAAYQTLASVLPGAGPCEQVYSEVYGRRSAIVDPYEIRDGKIMIRDAPGLGVTLDPGRVEEVTLEHEIFG